MAENISESQFSDAKPGRDSNLHHILRIYIPRGYEKQRTADILDYCRRTGCSDVLFFTTSYDAQPSFISLDEITVDVERLRIVADQLRDAGIGVNINILQTLGHVYYPRAMQQEFPFQRRVTQDGCESTAGACPLCSNLREWVIGSYSLYASLKPQILFVDDDYRTVLHGLTCFCDLHLKRMSGIVGHAVTRQDVVAAIKDPNWPAARLRVVFHEVNTRGLCELARHIRDAVHAVSPETRIGLMACRPPAGELGMDITQIIQELAGTHRPLVRPQSGMYSEGFLRDMPKYFMEPDWLRAITPDEIEHYPEIENYNYSCYAKSAQCTFVQMAAQVLMGFNHLALNVFDMYSSPFADNEALISLMERRRSFLNALHSLIPEGRRPLGIETFVQPNNPLINRVSTPAGDSVDTWLDWKVIAGRLPCLGLPMTHSGHSPWLFLSGDDVLGLSDHDLDSLLRQGAVIDVKAAQALALRGQSTRIGVRVDEPIVLDDLGYEEFIDPQLSIRWHGRCFPLRPLVADGDWHRLIDLTGKGRMASVIRNFRKEIIGPALLLTENGNGERFAVLAFAGNGDRHLIENLMRGEQLRETFAWVARKPLPIVLTEENPYLWPIINYTADGRVVLGVINLSSDTYDSVSVKTAPDSISHNVHVLDETGCLTGVQFENDIITGNRVIRYRLTPLELAVFVFDDHGR